MRTAYQFTPAHRTSEYRPHTPQATHLTKPAAPPAPFLCRSCGEDAQGMRCPKCGHRTEATPRPIVEPTHVFFGRGCGVRKGRPVAIGGHQFVDIRAAAAAFGCSRDSIERSIKAGEFRGQRAEWVK